jgi:hypothetical protein
MMTVTLRYTEALGRLCKHFAELIEEEHHITFANVYWLQTFSGFRQTDAGDAWPSTGATGRIDTLFRSSGLAAVLLGEEHLEDLKKGRIKRVRLVDQIYPKKEIVLRDVRKWRY